VRLGVQKAVVVPGTGLGGFLTGIGGLCEFGKIGLNPGTDRVTGHYPQTVGVFDFAAEAPLVRNFEHLTQPLSATERTALHVARVRDGETTPQHQDLAREVYRAMARVLSDFTYLLGTQYLVDDVSLGGGILQQKTREFVVTEMLARAARLGMELAATSQGVRIVEITESPPFTSVLNQLSAASAGTFLTLAWDAAIQFFSPVHQPDVRARLPRYVPLFGLTQILNEMARRFPDSVCEAELELDAGRSRVLLPMVQDIDPAIRDIMCRHVFCELQTRAMIGGYVHPSNFEGSRLAGSLAAAGLPGEIQRDYLRAYEAHGFAVLIESYRERAVRRQRVRPPLLPAPQMLAGLPSLAPGLYLGIDIGATTWKGVALQPDEAGLMAPRVTMGPHAHGAGPVASRDFFQGMAHRVHHDLRNNGLDPATVRSVCVAWPGAVDSQGPAAFSGILKLLQGMPQSIVATTDEHLEQVNVVRLFGEAWNAAATDIRLCNDAAAFGAYYWNRDVFVEPLLTPRFHGAAGAALLALGHSQKSG